MSHDFGPPPTMPVYAPPPPPPPKKTNTVVVAVAAAVVAAAVSAAITAGVTSGGDAEAAPTVTVTETTAAEGTEAAADTDPAPTPEDTSDGVYGLGDTVTYETDVEVGLSKFSRGVSSDYASPENMPYAKFTIKIVNKSDETLNADEMSVNCAYGDEGKEGEAIFDEGLNGLPETRILAGRSLSVPWGCELPKGEKFLQVEVAPDYDSETAIFTGNVK
ncbi:hypothetical protein FE633_38070 [Streptomyces montanus]|uniref:DUF4352 domain-containing protein n=1 Tax=Streptomyces montanus TaxID=2580423 RepID=A0A5R9FG22_9ACTN|nr:hypothetical protein [Streptomyces montanus]TLS41100.1 hypothetical protein FE633_38070 [Streptomyces montanus]